MNAHQRRVARRRKERESRAALADLADWARREVFEDLTPGEKIIKDIEAIVHDIAHRSFARQALKRVLIEVEDVR